MLIKLVLMISICLQLIAAGLALRLARITMIVTAWVMIALALILMAVSNGVQLFSPDYYGLTLASPGKINEEIMKLISSTILVFGLALIIKLILEIKSSMDQVNKSKEEYEFLLNRDLCESLLRNNFKITQKSVQHIEITC